MRYAAEYPFEKPQPLALDRDHYSHPPLDVGDLVVADPHECLGHGPAVVKPRVQLIDPLDAVQARRSKPFSVSRQIQFHFRAIERHTQQLLIAICNELYIFILANQLQ